MGGEEAKNISALEAANQASPEQIAAIHAKADDEVIDILKESGMDSDVVTAGVLHSMYDLKLQENDALRHMNEGSSMSEGELARRVQAIHDRTAIEAATIAAQISKNHAKRNQKLMQRLAARKQKEAIEITGAINLAQITGKTKEEVQAEIASIKERSEKDIEILVSALSERGDKQKTKQENKILRAMNKLAEISIIEDHATDKMKDLEAHESAMESRIKDMESNHQNEVEGLHRKLKVEKNKQLDNLQKRLALRRKNARKGGVSSVRRQQIENETKTIEELADARRLREEAEEEMQQLNRDFDHHQEELAKHMAIEKEQQRANIEVRLRRRRSKNAAAGKKKGVDEDKSARHLNALLETRKRMEHDVLRRAYERMSKGGLTSEQQLRALLQDVQRISGSSSSKAKDNKIAAPRIKKPGVVAVEQAKEAVDTSSTKK